MPSADRAPNAPERTGSAVHVELELHGEGGAPVWVAAGRIVEGVSQPYAAELEILVDEPGPSPAALLDTRASLRLTRACDDAELIRVVHGIVWRAEEAGRVHDTRRALRVFLAPELWLLSRRQSSRVFHHLTAIDIVERVLDDAELYEGSARQKALDPGVPYRLREYCVQYRESDLAFVERLLEEEGIAYWFEHDEDAARETLVLHDGARGALAGAAAQVPSRAAGAAIPWVSYSEQAQTHAEETITRFERCAELRSSGVALHDHDFTNAALRAALTPERAGAGRELTVYEHPGRFTFTEYEDVDIPVPALPPIIHNAIPAPRYRAHDGARVAALRFEELRGGDAVLRGRGEVIGLAPGRTFRVLDQASGETLGPFVVLRVEHDLASERSKGERASDDAGSRYGNTFECLPVGAPYRPPRKTPRPIVSGAQTGTVVGEPGDEVRTDYYGRIKVEMHWDRERACESQGRAAADVASDVERDPGALIWVRVAQAWAGPGWGTVFIPRVGMEVVVTFLDGDPDRPLVVGCVYNSTNTPPYLLPGEHAKATIRSHSTPSLAKVGGRVGFNELRFDDTANLEQVYLHAERDLKEKIRNHHETRVLGSQDNEVRVHQHNRVGGSQLEKIGGSQALVVGGVQSLHVGAQRSVTVEGTERHLSVGGLLGEVRAFGTHLVHGLHLHAVAPSSMPSPESLEHVARVKQHVAAILAARARGFAVDPYLGTALPIPPEDPYEPHDEHERGEGAHDEWPRHAADWSDYGAPIDPAAMQELLEGPGGGAFAPPFDPSAPRARRAEEPAPPGEPPEVEIAPYLETYLVEGRRLKVIADHEDVVVHGRTSAIAVDDVASVGRTFSVTAGSRAAMLVHGTQLSNAQGLTLSDAPAQVDLFLGGDGLRLDDERLQLRRRGKTLFADDDVLELTAASGTLGVHLLDEDDGAWGMTISDGGAELDLTTQTESSIAMRRDVTVTAKGKLTLSADDGAARIVMSPGGKIELIASEIVLKGNVKTE
ncbi:MAG: type VI secretion system tip protein VgrG [Sandaracinaceae bacterium]|nr:type VI secretion system tip protein VgrG [Sandaracinaceae bacterium]